MTKRTIIYGIVFLLFTIHYSLFTISNSFSAEIRLRNEPVNGLKTLVTLGDVAEIVPGTNDDVDQLRQIVLFTTPTQGETRTLDHIELRDILSRSGYSFLKYQLAGAARVVVSGNSAVNGNSGIVHAAGTATEPPVVAASYHYDKTANNFVIKTVSNVTPAMIIPAETRPVNQLRKYTVSPQLIKTLEQQIAEAIVVYLNTSTVPQTGTVTKYPWKVTVKLSQEQARLLASNGQIEEIVGGTNPPVGQQRFGIRMQKIDPTTEQNVVVTIDAAVELPQEVVVLRRSLPKGYLINESDVSLKRVENLKDENFFVDIAEVVGQETTISARELNVLTSGMIKKPVWVHKGDIVTVRSVNNGIIVRVEGIAQNEGTQGDTIAIETINPNTNKRGRNGKSETSTYLARVCDPKTVEVLASGVIVE